MRRGLVHARALLAALGLGATLAACSPPPRAVTGCVDQRQAERIWRSVDDGLNAVALDASHAGLERVATGNALDMVRQYIAQQLVAQHVTEREVDRLESLTVLEAGCGKGALRVRVSVTLVQDDYLAPDGHVDHADEAVGSTFHLIETYVRSGSSWKESEFIDTDQPSPTPQLL